MDELAKFRDQLAYVNVSLEADPKNDDLLKLKSELVELIELTEQTLPAPTADKGKAKAKLPPNTVAPGEKAGQAQGVFRPGEDCMARYKDGKWYPARISAIAGSIDSPTFTITFKGYSTSTTVPHSSLRPNDPFAPIPVPVTTKRKTPEEIKRDERENEKKRKKGEKWQETMNEREKDVKGKMNAWQNFGKKAQKKGVHISGFEGKSIFRTPENPHGKVGVTGSGRGVTEYESRGKHKFTPAENDA